MIIGLEPCPVTTTGGYSECLCELFPRYAPEHEYVVDCNNRDDLDIYHGFGSVPPSFRGRRASHVVTVRNLRCLCDPQLFSWKERLSVLRLYRKTVRTADRLIVLNGRAGCELVRRLEIDARRIEVVLPLAACPPAREPDERRLESVRMKYGLPDRFLLTLGPVESRRHLPELVDAMLDAQGRFSCVVCSRRTPGSDRLLAYARKVRAAARLELLYEWSPDDLPALFRLAFAFVRLSDVETEAPVAPIVEAMRAGLPLVLSDVPLHREAAGDAALYVRPDSRSDLAAALGRLDADPRFYGRMSDRSFRCSELFSERAVVRRLLEIYSTL